MSTRIFHKLFVAIIEVSVTKGRTHTGKCLSCSYTSQSFGSPSLTTSKQPLLSLAPFELYSVSSWQSKVRHLIRVRVCLICVGLSVDKFILRNKRLIIPFPMGRQSQHPRNWSAAPRQIESVCWLSPWSIRLCSCTPNNNRLLSFFPTVSASIRRANLIW